MLMEIVKEDNAFVRLGLLGYNVIKLRHTFVPMEFSRRADASVVPVGMDPFATVDWRNALQIATPMVAVLQACAFARMVGKALIAQAVFVSKGAKLPMGNASMGHAFVDQDLVVWIAHNASVQAIAPGMGFAYRATVRANRATLAMIVL